MTLTNIHGAARHLGISPHTVRHMVRRQVLPHYRLGRAVRLAIEDLDAYLERCRVPAKGELTAQERGDKPTKPRRGGDSKWQSEKIA